MSIDSLPLTKTTNYHKMNDNLKVDRTLAGSMNVRSVLTIS